MWVPAAVFTIGQYIHLHNNGNNVRAIYANSGVTLKLAGTANTGNRVFGSNGVATILCVSNTDSFVIMGQGIN